MARDAILWYAISLVYTRIFRLICEYIGMNFVLFVGCITTLTIYRRTPTINKILLSVALIMFFFSSVHVSLGFQRLIEGFIRRREWPGGPTAFFSDVSIPANVVKVGIHTVNVSQVFKCPYIERLTEIPPCLLTVY